MLFTPLNWPPAKILPSACTAIEKTVSFAFGSNESAKPVVPSSRAMRMRVCPPMLVKKPPAKILPSACTAIEDTLVFAFGSNETADERRVGSRARQQRVCAPVLEKQPPAQI